MTKIMDDQQQTDMMDEKRNEDSVSSNNNNNNRYDSKCPATPTSCLRSTKKGGMTRNVSFPDDENQIVTGILEPESPWMDVAGITNDDLISFYMRSCEKHGTYPLPVILEQLAKLDLAAERNESFSLKSLTLDANICETLEEILKRVQFHSINLESTSLNDETSIALFDMLEYYESATKLNISSNPNINVRGWQACSRLIKKTYCLEELEVSNTSITETHMPILSRALKLTNQLQILKLENCNLTGRPLITLASALKTNGTLKELYLSKNDLGLNDACQLSSMIKSNVTLQLLDISHNNITDAGMNTLMDGIIDQCFGLSVLIVWNNHLTRHIANSVSRFLEKFTGLEMLNIGMNTLGDEFLRAIKLPLTTNRNLLKLGMQSTYLSDEAAFIFSEILTRNSLLQRIDLRDNNIQIAGLKSLTKGLQNNSTILQMDLDKLPRKAIYVEDSTVAYKKLIEEIRNKCCENEVQKKEREDAIDSETDDQLEELSHVYKKLNLSFISSRKISLTCESLHFQRPVDNDAAAATTSNVVVTASNGTSAAAATSDNNLLNEPKKNTTRLRSPAPSPVPSPVSTPPPTRTNRFVVEKVQEKARSPSSLTPSAASLSPSPSPPPLSTKLSPVTTASFTTNANSRFTSNNTRASSSSSNSTRFKIVVVEPARNNNNSCATKKPICKNSDDTNNSKSNNNNDVIHAKEEALKVTTTSTSSVPIIPAATTITTSASSVSIIPATTTNNNNNIADIGLIKNHNIESHRNTAADQVDNTDIRIPKVLMTSAAAADDITAVTISPTRTIYDSNNNNNDTAASKQATTKVNNEPVKTIPSEQQIPITEKIRKLSWVSPIFQSSSSIIDTHKIPANLEKLLGLFQNPFTNTKTTATPTPSVASKSSSSTFKLNNEEVNPGYDVDYSQNNNNNNNNNNNSTEKDKRGLNKDSRKNNNDVVGHTNYCTPLENYVNNQQPSKDKMIIAADIPSNVNTSSTKNHSKYNNTTTADAECVTKDEVKDSSSVVNTETCSENSEIINLVPIDDKNTCSIPATSFVPATSKHPDTDDEKNCDDKEVIIKEDKIGDKSVNNNYHEQNEIDKLTIRNVHLNKNDHNNVNTNNRNNNNISNNIVSDINDYNNKLKTDYDKNDLFEFISQYDATSGMTAANVKIAETEIGDFPATWPQKLTTTPFLCSPSRSSPSILEATALMFLQGQVSSDLAVGIQNMNLSREEKAADQI